MTDNRRIGVNAAATYARSLFGLVCGLLVGRWVLAALGQVDYGIFGVVGGLLACIDLINRALALANSRFFAFSIGMLGSGSSDGAALEEVRRWFNVSVLIHTGVPLLLIAAGLPLGEYAIRHWLVIPPERMFASVWVFRLSCGFSFLGMVTVPYCAMFTAKQEIAEQTLYSFLSTCIMVVFGYYMVTHPGDWMIRFSIATGTIAALPTMILVVRALCAFPECRFNLGYMFDFARIKELFSFAGWCLLAVLANMLRSSGIAILINKGFGPAGNAAYSVGNQVDGKVVMLNESLKGAFAPAVHQAYGAGDGDHSRKLVLGMCKFGLWATLLFAIPIFFESDFLLKVWLVNPPESAAMLARCLILTHVAGVMSQGFDTAVGAKGRIVKYILFTSMISLLTLPVAAAAMAFGGGLKAIGISIVITMTIHSVTRVMIAGPIVGVGANVWLRSVAFPGVAVMVTASIPGAVLNTFMPDGWIRCLTISIVSVIVFATLVWLVGMSTAERTLVKSKLSAVLGRHA